MAPARSGRIILVRHGETEANVRGYFADSDEIPLTETGRLQARRLAARLAREFHPTALVSSIYRRARETGEIIGMELGLTAEVTAGIHERGFGILRGHPYARLVELMPAEVSSDPVRTRLWRPEGGESLEDVRARVVPVLERLRDRYRGEHVVVVCHGAVMRAIRAHITGNWDETYVIGNCGILALGYDGGRWQRADGATGRNHVRTITSVD